MNVHKCKLNIVVILYSQIFNRILVRTNKCWLVHLNPENFRYVGLVHLNPQWLSLAWCFCGGIFR